MDILKSKFTLSVRMLIPVVGAIGTLIGFAVSNVSAVVAEREKIRFEITDIKHRLDKNEPRIEKFVSENPSRQEFANLAADVKELRKEAATKEELNRSTESIQRRIDDVLTVVTDIRKRAD